MLGIKEDLDFYRTSSNYCLAFGIYNIVSANQQNNTPGSTVKLAVNLHSGECGATGRTGGVKEKVVALSVV